VVVRALTVAVLAAGSLTLAAPASRADSTVPPAPSIDADAPDPFVLDTGSGWLVFATGSLNVSMWRSPDLRTFTAAGSALGRAGSWVDGTDPRIWAPSVVHRGSAWLLYYTARDRTLGRQCIGLATSDQPDGPYVDGSAAPFLCQPDIGGSIDASPFVDDNGGLYLLWKNDGNCCGRATTIWSAPLAPDGRSVAGWPAALLGPAETWEHGIVEAPSMVRTASGLVLFYSAGPYASGSYAVGTVDCDTPLGPCRRPRRHSVLGTTSWWVGPGGAEVTRASNGALILAVHGWPPGRIGYGAGGYRRLYLFEVTFAGDEPQLWTLDGRRLAPTAVRSPLVVAVAPRPDGQGAFALREDGSVAPSGSAVALGGLESSSLRSPAVAIASTPSGAGYWVASADGGVFAFGDAPFLGSMGGARLARPVVAIAATPSGRGYWLVASDGGVFAFGDAAFFGSTGALALVRPIVGMSPTPSGRGYWLVASDGGVFAFGDAPFVGSLGGTGTDDVVGVEPTRDRAGYWLPTSEGLLYPFGDASPLA